jgi:hypothetical protein
MAMQKGVNKIKGAIIIKQSTYGKAKVFTKDCDVYVAFMFQFIRYQNYISNIIVFFFSNIFWIRY